MNTKDSYGAVFRSQIGKPDNILTHLLYFFKSYITKTGGNTTSAGDYFQRWMNPHLVL